MEERKTAIQLSGVKKKYQLGQIGGGTLQGDLQSWWAKLRGKTDPNSKIGQEQRLSGDSFMALNGIDLTIYKGEAVGIIGSNGAGKSTMLKLLSRVTAPTEGVIDIYGRISSMLEVGTGFNSQMTGRENIYMNGAILGLTRAEIDDRMEDIIEFSEVREFIDTPVKRYSSGMFVKLAFAVAAHLDSEIMIMDEVLAVGDMAFQKKCLTKMREAAAQDGRTVLYVSHNMNTIRELCDRCIVMEAGRIIYDGEVEEAIRIYMNSAIGVDEVDMDLTQKPHAAKKSDTGLVMKHLTLEGKTLPVFDNQETVKLRFGLTIARPLQQIQMRMTVRTDDDQAVGTVWAAPMDFPEEGDIQVTYEFPLQLLAKGVYYVSLGFYQMNDGGRMIMFDHITRACKLEVIPSVGIQNWNTRAFGSILFPEIRGDVNQE